MKQPTETPMTVDAYIEAFPPETQSVLQKIRAIIHEEAPEVEEALAYGIPTFRLKGNLVHFAGYQKHIGFYPAPSGIAAFKSELGAYKHAKGSVQFSLDQPIPYDLIREMVRFRVKESQG